MTKAKFIAFEKVRRSGKTNMFDITRLRLIALTYGQMLTEKDCFDIMLNYDKYRRKYLATKKWFTTQMQLTCPKLIFIVKL